MKKVYCPVNGWDCPYWQKDGSCSLDNPIECDDFTFFWNEGDDYWVEEEKNENE